MTTLRLLLIVFSLTLLISPPLVGKEPIVTRYDLSLDDATKMALENSSGIKAARTDRELGTARVKQARALLMPSITFSETYLRANDQVAVFASKLKQGLFTAADFDVNLLNRPQSIDNFETKVSLNVPLFTSGMNSFAVRAAKKALAGNEDMVRHNEASLKLNVALTYYGIVSNEESLESIEKGINHLRKLEDSYKLIRAPNSATTTCFLLAQATRFGLEQKSTESQTMLTNLRKTLKSILEIPQDSEVNLTDPLGEDYGSVSDDDKLKSTGRNDIKAMKLNLEAIRLEKKSIYSMFGPRVDFFGAYAYNTPDFDNGEDSYQLGFVLTLNFFDYSRYAKLAGLKAMENRLRFALAESSKNNATGISAAKEKYKGKAHELKLAKSSFEKANEALKFANLRYREGTLALKDLSDAIARWVEAKVNLSMAKYSLAESFMNLKLERGEL